MGKTQEQVAQEIAERHRQLQEQLLTERGEAPHQAANYESIGGKAQHILETLHPDEPIFVLRGKDILSVLAVQHYLGLLEVYAGSARTEQIEELVEFHQQLKDWQRTHPHLVRFPD